MAKRTEADLFHLKLIQAVGVVTTPPMLGLLN